MKSDDIFEVIHQIARTASKLEKVAIIAKHKDDAEFKRVLVAALDPLTTYGIAVLLLPERTGGISGREFIDKTWGIIEGLASRNLTGNMAQVTVRAELESLSPPSAELFGRIITQDLKAGFGESTVNKAIKGLIQEFPYMRCSLPKEAKLDQFDWRSGVFSQEKADGMFANLDYTMDGTMYLRSRQGTPIPLGQFPGLRAVVPARVEPGTEMHGELLVIKAGKVCAREIGNGILNSVIAGGEFAADEEGIYLAWDQIPLKAVVAKGKYSVPYAGRFRKLVTQIGSVDEVLRVIDTEFVHSLQEAYEHYRRLLKLGKEGTVVKCPSGPWSDSTSKFQVKLKLDVDVDLVIVGFNPGEGKNAATFGSVIARTSDGLLEVGVSGMKDAVRKEVSDNRESYLGTVMAVKSNGVMAPSEEGKLHSLFLPRLVEFRKDKRVADTLSRVHAQFASAIAAA